MGIHPDDPPWEIFLVCQESLKKFSGFKTDPFLGGLTRANGITFCTGSLGADPTNDLPTMIREIGHRINFCSFPQCEVFR